VQSGSKFTVVIAKSARKDFEGLPQNIVERIFAGLQRLSTNPFPGTWKAIRRLRLKEPTYRLRISDYRVIYRVQERKIFVLKIVSRKDLEKELKKMKSG